MELQLLISNIPLLASSFLLLLAFFAIPKRSKSGRVKLPPGPRKLPLIGNLHNLAGSHPHRAFRDLARKYGPIIHLNIGEVPTYVVSTPELAREVMKTHDVTFATRPYVLAADVLFYDRTDIIFAPYSEYWKYLRKMCALKLLSPSIVKSFQSIREEEVWNLCQRIAENAGSPVNLSDSIFTVAYGITARTAFGKKYNGQHKFIKLIADNVKVTSGFDIADVFPSFKWLHVITGSKANFERLHREIDEIIQTILDEHREALANGKPDDAEEDLIDVLLKIEQTGDDSGITLSSKNIKAVIFDMFGGGSETSATSVDWAFAEMIKSPKILAKAQAEVRRVFDKYGKFVEEEIHQCKYLDAIIKETLRVHPPGPLIHRECRETCEIGGYQIPEKSMMMVNVWAIERDGNYWTNPEKFDPERFVDSTVDYIANDFQFIPFGGGRRMCPGMNFGLANMKVEIGMLLYHFDWTLPNGMKNEDLDMSESFGLTVRRRDNMMLIPIPYQPPKIVPRN